MHFMNTCTLTALAFTVVVSANAVVYEEKRQAGCKRDNGMQEIFASLFIDARFLALVHRVAFGLQIFFSETL